MEYIDEKIIKKFTLVERNNAEDLYNNIDISDLYLQKYFMRILQE